MAATYDDLVLRLEQVDGKDETIMALRAAGEDAKPALLRGMRHPAWRVRHGCLRVLDHTVVDDPTRRAVLEALNDPHRKVRAAALHVLGCEVCKPEGYCGIEGVDIDAVHIDLVSNDPSRRVRRSALGTFMWRAALEDDTADAIRHLLANEEDDAVRRRAAMALVFPDTIGIQNSRERRTQFNESVEALLNR